MPAANAGRSTALWRRLKAQQRAKRLPCWLCGMPIDYSLKYPDPGSFTVDHVRSWVNHPELREDPGNLVSAHASCNWAKGDREQFAPDLGNLSTRW
jgi:5-methylcytosine-specific restriction endonuclease McrA